MLDPTTKPEFASRPEVVELAYRLKDDAILWAQAETALAKVELHDLRSKAIRAVIFAVAGFAAAFSALVVLALATIAFLTPVIGSEGFAALIVAAAYALIVAGCALAIRNAGSWQADSVFFRWFARPSTPGESQ